MEHDVICLGPFKYLMVKRQRKLLIIFLWSILAWIVVVFEHLMHHMTF